MLWRMIKFLVKTSVKVIVLLVVVVGVLYLVNYFFDTPIDGHIDKVVSSVTGYAKSVDFKDSADKVTGFAQKVDFKGAADTVKSYAQKIDIKGAADTVKSYAQKIDVKGAADTVVNYVKKIDLKGFKSVVSDYVGKVDLSALTDDELFDYFLSHYEEFTNKGATLLENFWSNDTVYWDEKKGEIVQETPTTNMVVPASVTGGAAELLTVSSTYLGVPYRYGGTSRKGIDCSGFVGAVHKEALGLSLPRTAHDIYTTATNVDNASLVPGNLVFFSASGSKISHVGIYMGEGKFIHAASAGPKTGVIVSKLSEGYWSRTYVGGGVVF